MTYAKGLIPSLMQVKKQETHSAKTYLLFCYIKKFTNPVVFYTSAAL